MNDEEKDVRHGFTVGPWGIGVLGKEDGTPELDKAAMKKAFSDSIDKGEEGIKCYFVTAKIDGKDVTIGYTGNGPTSEANAQIISYVPELVTRINELDAELTALRSRLSLADRLVAADKIIDSITAIEDYIYDVRGREGNGWEGKQVKEYAAAVKERKAALRKFDAATKEGGVSHPRD